MQPQDQQGKEQPQQQPQQKSSAVPPQQTNVNKWADQGQKQAGAMQKPAAEQAQQKPIQKPDAFVQPPQSNQPKEAQEDRSKSFGESQQQGNQKAGQIGDAKSQQPGETGIIPKENSFPAYREELPGVDSEQPESIKH